MEVKFNADEFHYAMEFWYQHSKKTLAEQMHTELKGIVRNVVEITPPGDFSNKGLAAKKQGEGRIKSDLHKLFNPIAARSGQGFGFERSADLPNLHKRHRNRRGRITGKPGYYVKQRDFNAYQKTVVKRVGKLAAGWNRAAARFGYKPPAWVWRHASPGFVRVTLNDRHLNFVMINKVPYAGEQKNMEARIQYAINMQENKLKRRINNRWKAASPFK